MSLVHHVTPLEGIDREPEPFDDTDTTAITAQLEDFNPIRRKISYDVIPSQIPVIDDKAGTPAYKISTATRIRIVFGFAALKPVLVEEGVYHDLCTEEELQNGVELCHAQDLRLNMFFVIASITANVSSLPVGTILDRYGSRVCGFAGCISLALGSLFMAASFSQPEFDGYMAGNFFLALGGTFIFIPSFQIANAFPKHAGTIVALVTGAFDASAAVYLFYRLLYETNPQRYTPARFFLFYLLVPAVILLALVTVMPTHEYQNTLQLEVKVEKAEDATRDVHDSDDEIESDGEVRRLRRARAERRHDKMRMLDEVLGDKDERDMRRQHEEERLDTSFVWGALHGLSAREQMLTPWFVLITLMTVLQMLRMNYFIATIRSQYEHMLQSEVWADHINDFFDVALPVGGVVSTPLIGFMLDRLSVPSILGIIVALTTVIGVLNSIPAMWTGYLTVILFVVLRPLYYSAMSDYATKVFGFATFGRVYGTIICFSGLVNFAQYGLDSLTHGPLKGNPIPINAFFAIVGFLIGVALVTFVVVAGRRIREQRRLEFEDEERQRLIPEEDEEEGEEGEEGEGR
ncbi:hypothetical protein FE257_002671 [Aspergillus nanangensis]|uniref:MFS transporter n=1 Tax=Aspergillus nanangensis TaxID=2582783 RepID=A0AAD4CCU6_ASPNN|nr:hypothetical protein FE257_002671 [Aspergillus nanangensis]